MVVTHYTDAREAPASLSSSDLERSEEALSAPDEASPLLQDGRVQRSLSERCHSALSAFIDKNAGLLLVAASQFFFAVSNVFVKWLNSQDEHVPILELIWVRSVVMYTCSVAYMYWQNISDPFFGPKDVRPLLFVRGCTGFTALSGMYFSLQYLSLSDAVVLKYLAPILTGFSGAIFLKESLSLRGTVAGLFSFFGVILIARPPFLFGGHLEKPSEVVTSGKRMLSVTAALVGVLGSTGSYTLLRAIGKRAHALHILSFFSLLCFVFSTIGMIAFNIPPVIPTRGSWVAMMFLNGIFALIGQTLMAMGFQRETASRGTLAMYTSVVFAILLEFVVFHTTPTPLSIAGAIVIMSSAVYTSLAKKAAARPTADPVSDGRSPATPVLDDDREAR